MNKSIKIGNRVISPDSPTYIVAEMSANHNLDFDRAKRIIFEAREAGADAVKIQTYRPDTITIDCDNEEFMTTGIWKGQTLFQLYSKAYTPWEWHPELKRYADEIGIDLFSSPFDLTAVDLLEEMDVPAYKIASFEINDIPLIKAVAETGKPILISTGVAYLADIELAVDTCRRAGNDNVILLKCVSEYPAPYEMMNINQIRMLRKTFDCIAGLSDHSMGSEVPVASVAIGGKVIEKHFTLSRDDGGEDSTFSMEPAEFKEMVNQIRNVERAMGKEEFSITEKQIEERKGSRSLYVVSDIKKGECITKENVKSIRPGRGMHTKYWEEIVGKTVNKDLEKGTPMDWKYIQ